MTTTDIWSYTSTNPTNFSVSAIFSFVSVTFH